jgi:hypothetical protein
MVEDEKNFWKMTSIGLVIAAIVAVVSGVVVANRTRPVDTRVVVAPSASPATTVDDPKVTPSRPSTGVPPQSVVAECNRVAASMSGPEGARDEKILNTAKGAGAGTLYGIYDSKKHDERYRSAYIGCMKSKGYTA